MPDLNLPPQFTRLRRLLRCLGGPMTLQLLRAHGGTNLKIPMSTRNSQLVDEIGTAAVQMLIDEFGAGERIMMPMPDKIEAHIRNAAIWWEADQGVHVSEQARRYTLTQRQIINIRNQRRQPAANDPVQQSAFGF